MTLTDIIGGISLVLIILTTVFNAFQVVYLFVPFFVKRKPHKQPKQNRYAILIAARNEENVLPHLLDSIAAQDYPAELITTYVVADNCTDRTAEIAAARGAHVFPRFNTEKVGKGYAINYLISKIREEGTYESYDAFLVIDADNLLMPDYITQMNMTCSDGYDAFCGYRNSKNLGTNWISACLAMWYLHDSVHLNQSRMLLGNPCFVTGTGFGFTRKLLDLQGGNWSFFTLTEDTEFSTWCATRGIKVGYNHDAMLFDEQPEKFKQSWRQRTRWTQGGIQVSIRRRKDYFQGLKRGGRTTYASFEALMLSMWGYILGILCGIFGVINTLLTAGWTGIGIMALSALPVLYFSMFFVGLLTTITEWDRIRATTGQKIMALFTYPLYMITYVPICITAIFRKFHWPPIEHTVAVSADSLINK